MQDDHECDACGGSGRVADPDTSGAARSRYHLSRGWRKHWLITELAKGEASHAELARLADCRTTSVTAFALRFAAEIERVQRDISAEMVGLWIAHKALRVAEYQQDVEDADELIVDSGRDDLPVLVRIKQSALRAVAEELGQIPNRVRMDLGGQVVTYQLEGVRTEDL